ncbi:MAG: Bacterial trigger factor like protein [Candidatus Collierbacteria bacterium GW2011_GWE1_46_18]|uniref:Bacterial trigger factor like protein n=1 Tax=Candidatus Collierbacteria bacterium GW2011_GWE1_46_18 TaxID=1618399 RepID=A0A0G1S1Z8_9BACT|nr:MAG: Bacterial trigger factor like protein [Candidatus Collierbacteria bacterium GW2011_GWE1_46_18]
MAKETVKKTVRKSVKKAVPAKSRKTEIIKDIQAKNAEIKVVKKNNMSFVIKLIAVILLGTAAFLLAQKYRSVFVAGMVNTRPVTKWELNRRLVERYGKVAFDEIVTEVLLMDAAKENGVTVSKQEIEAEVVLNETNYGGKDALREMAKTAGITTDKQLNDFFELKLTVSKLQEKLFPEEVTDEEIKTYYDENKELVYKDKSLDDVKEEIKSQLLQQKVSQKFSEWFGKLREDAKISNFMES